MLNIRFMFDTRPIPNITSFSILDLVKYINLFKAKGFELSIKKPISFILSVLGL